MINEPHSVHEQHTLHERHYPFTFKRISWSAIFVGALVALGLSFLLNLFAVAIGLSAFTVNESGATVIAIGGLIGLLIGLIASMLVAGYAAGYLGRLYCPKRNLGILYGFTTWSLALVLSAFVATHVSNYASMYSRAATGSAPVVATVNDNNAAPVSVTTKTDTAADTANSDNQKVAKVNVTSEGLAWGAFTLFGLFFIGALASCIGACWAMTCHRED